MAAVLSCGGAGVGSLAGVGLGSACLTGSGLTSSLGCGTGVTSVAGIGFGCSFGFGASSVFGFSIGVGAGGGAEVVSTGLGLASGVTGLSVSTLFSPTFWASGDNVRALGRQRRRLFVQHRLLVALLDLSDGLDRHDVDRERLDIGRWKRSRRRQREQPEGYRDCMQDHRCGEAGPHLGVYCSCSCSETRPIFL